MLKGVKDGGVELYYDNVKHFSTHSSGVFVSSDANLGRLILGDTSHNYGWQLAGYDAASAGSGGRLVEQDANGGIVLDKRASGGNIFCYNTIKMNGNATVDNLKLVFGAGSDFEIFHDGTTNRFQSNGLKNFQFNPKDTDVGLKIIGDGAVELYNDNNKMAETYSGGFKVSNGGELYIDGNAASGHCQLIMTRSDRSWAINNETNFRIYTVSGNNGNPTSGWTKFLEINHVGDLMPGSNASQDLGTSSTRWDNLYINDLQLSNKGKSNDVDGTWGDWTLQEGESDVYMINNRSGKKFKIKMEEVE